MKDDLLAGSVPLTDTYLDPGRSTFPTSEAVRSFLACQAVEMVKADKVAGQHYVGSRYYLTWDLSGAYTASQGCMWRWREGLTNVRKVTELLRSFPESYQWRLCEEPPGV